ncbi:MAG TPA: DeoR/GlpR family DNA-binding transcription regulator [Mesorhizobium sp.]|jgi:DeoR family glycerol-3-phosphate regulon repressor|nr:DeoR/GlpR family DNA-binding transcription regulator [Mesorhizobium sp.]
MRRKDRQARIADVIWRQGQMSVDALAETFAVSPETIRRDLGQLAEGGMLQKVHGGARRPRLHTEGSFGERMAENADAKRAIAQKLLALVEPGDTLFMDTGSTTVFCAEALSRLERLTVITNSVRVAQALGVAGSGSAVYLLGGAYGADNAQTVGPLAIEQIEKFEADHAVLTVAAIDAGAGAMDASFDEAQVARAMIGHAKNLIVVAGGEKFGRKAAFRVCRLDEIDVIVSDAPPSLEHTAALQAAKVELR